MGMRVHTGSAMDVSLSVVDGARLVELYGEQFVGIDHALVIEDTNNLEATVLVGEDDELRTFAGDILRILAANRRQRQG